MLKVWQPEVSSAERETIETNNRWRLADWRPTTRGFGDNELHSVSFFMAQ